MNTKITRGILKNKTIVVPKKARPTTSGSRNALCSSIMNLIPNAKVLDVFSGSGAVGIEFISSGASHVTFVEKDKATLKIINNNIAYCGIKDKTTCIFGDAFRKIKTIEEKFDLIFLDPPFFFIEKKINYIITLINDIVNNNCTNESLIILELPKNSIKDIEDHLGDKTNISLEIKKCFSSTFAFIRKI